MTLTCSITKVESYLIFYNFCSEVVWWWLGGTTWVESTTLYKVHYDINIPIFYKCVGFNVYQVMFALRRNKKLSELVVNIILFLIVCLCWFYVIYAGRVATCRYLEKIDFSEPVERITVLQLQQLSSENTNPTL